MGPRVAREFSVSVLGNRRTTFHAAAPFYLPRGPSSSTLLPTLISCCCFGNSHPSGRDAVPRGRDPAVLCMESRTQRRLVSRSGGERGPARMLCLKSLLVCHISSFVKSILGPRGRSVPHLPVRLSLEQGRASRSLGQKAVWPSQTESRAVWPEGQMRVSGMSLGIWQQCPE